MCGADIFTNQNEGELEGEDLLLSNCCMILSISSGVIGERKIELRFGLIKSLIFFSKFSSSISIFLDKVSPMLEKYSLNILLMMSLLLHWL